MPTRRTPRSITRHPTVLVAGGAGFVGSHLCSWLLQHGHRVHCVDNFQTGSKANLSALLEHKEFSVIEQDICRPLSSKLRVDAIYNLACAASPVHYQAEPIHTLLTSVVGIRNLLEHARLTGARFLQASTSEVYGDPECHPQTEDYWGHVNPTGPRACYDEGKRAAETLCFDYLRLGLVDVRVARIFNTYGPQMQINDGRIVSNLVCQALAGQPLTIYGSGEQTRSFCYVSDMVRGLVSLMTVARNPGCPINLGNPDEFTVNRLSELVLSLTHSDSRIVNRPLPVDDPRRRRPDITRARELLNWSPKIGLEQGLMPTIEYFDRVLSEVRKRRASKLPVARYHGGVANQGV
jgi:UDP-glucuronate decarboxylase